MNVNIENGNNNYQERIEKLKLEYPLGIPAELVILICQELEIYYLLETIKNKTKENEAVKVLNEIITNYKNFVKFSTN